MGISKIDKLDKIDKQDKIDKKIISLKRTGLALLKLSSRCKEKEGKKEKKRAINLPLRRLDCSCFFP